MHCQHALPLQLTKIKNIDLNPRKLIITSISKNWEILFRSALEFGHWEFDLKSDCEMTIKRAETWINNILRKIFGYKTRTF